MGLAIGEPAAPPTVARLVRMGRDRHFARNDFETALGVAAEEDSSRGALLRELFVEQGLPYALVDVDPAELLPWDGHPDPAAHRRIARELVAVLRPRLSHAQ